MAATAGIIELEKLIKLELKMKKLIVLAILFITLQVTHRINNR
jgi:hypothetical protein